MVTWISKKNGDGHSGFIKAGDVPLVTSCMLFTFIRMVLYHGINTLDVFCFKCDDEDM